jgi:hypothetical protein
MHRTLVSVPLRRRALTNFGARLIKDAYQIRSKDPAAMCDGLFYLVFSIIV